MRRLAFALLLGCLGAWPVSAQPKFPDAPIRMIVPYPPGGTPDILGRILAQRGAEAFGQQVIVENKPGAGGNIGADFVAHAKADGYTVLMCAFGFVTNISLNPKLSWHPLKDFDPVLYVGSVPSIAVVRKNLPVKSLAELIAIAKREPGKLTFASSGNGSSPHLGLERFKALAGIDVIHVPYKGAGQAMGDLVGGHVDFTFDNLPASLVHVKEGATRALAVLSDKRSRALPDVPTTAEAGLPGLTMTPWYGIVAPVKTPPEVLDRLNTGFNKLLGLPEIAKRFEELGVDMAGGSRDRFAAQLKSDVETWGKVIRDAGIKGE